MKIKRKEIPGIIAGVQQVNGMKDFMKAISLGRDIRALKAINDETDAALKSTKPEQFDELQAELTELVQKKAAEIKTKDGELVNEQAITNHVLNLWPKAKDWRACNNQYNEAYASIQNQEIDFENHTILEEKDLSKSVENIAIAEVISLFMK